MYKHTQIGWPIIILMGLVPLGALLFASIMLWFYAPRPHGTEWLVPLVFLPAMALLFVGTAVEFGSLTVTVDDERIRARFGPGPIQFTFRLSEVASCRPVTNLIGWGIKWWPIRGNLRSWIFNVSGWDKVELVMTDGRIYEIGTDEPQKLDSFIRQRLESTSHLDPSHSV